MKLKIPKFENDMEKIGFCLGANWALNKIINEMPIGEDDMNGDLMYYIDEIIDEIKEIKNGL